MKTTAKAKPVFSLVKYAASLKAKLTLPSEPRHARNTYEKTDVTRTWALYGPEKEF